MFAISAPKLVQTDLPSKAGLHGRYRSLDTCSHIGADLGAENGEGRLPLESRPGRDTCSHVGAGSRRRKKVKADFLAKVGLQNPGSVLLSHTVARAVPWAQTVLTSVFGMGTGVALSL